VVLLGFVKSCGDAEKSTVVTEERDQQQLNLAGATEENEKTADELASLQTVESQQGNLQSAQTESQVLATEQEQPEKQPEKDIVTAQGEVEPDTTEINRLKDDPGTSNTEIEQLQDPPKEAVDLQQELISTKQERDDGRAAEAVEEELKVVEATEHEQPEKHQLKDDLGASNTELEQMRDQAVDLQQELISTKQERDDARAAEAVAVEELKVVEAKKETNP